VGRFIQADSIVPSPGNPQHFNRYAYVLNNPLAFTDPGGHRECGPACEGDVTGENLDPCLGSDCFGVWGLGDPWGRGWTGDDTEVVIWTASALIMWATAPELLVGVGESAVAAPQTISTIIKFTPKHWLAALLGKAIAEEVIEADMTGTPFSPVMVVLDLLTQYGDDLLTPARSRLATGTGIGGGLGWDDEAIGGGGGGGARLNPDPDAVGPHTVFRRDPQTGEVTHYATYRPQTNPQNPNPWELEVRYDAVGKPHFNKATQQYVPTPHIHDPTVPGGVRLPTLSEIP
jgi:hypothetical protein